MLCSTVAVGLKSDDGVTENRLTIRPSKINKLKPNILPIFFSIHLKYIYIYIYHIQIIQFHKSHIHNTSVACTRMSSHTQIVQDHLNTSLSSMNAHIQALEFKHSWLQQHVHV